jgi:hypothetical protein
MVVPIVPFLLSRCCPILQLVRPVDQGFDQADGLEKGNSVSVEEGDDNVGLTIEEYNTFCARWLHFDAQMEWFLPQPTVLQLLARMPPPLGFAPELVELVVEAKEKAEAHALTAEGQHSELLRALGDTAEPDFKADLGSLLDGSEATGEVGGNDIDLGGSPLTPVEYEAMLKLVEPLKLAIYDHNENEHVDPGKKGAKVEADLEAAALPAAPAPYEPPNSGHGHYEFEDLSRKLAIRAWQNRSAAADARAEAEAAGEVLPPSPGAPVGDTCDSLVAQLRNVLLKRGGGKHGSNSVEVQQIKDLFAEMDSDHNGELDKKQFLHGCLNVGIRISPQELNLVWPLFDSDGSGTIDTDELTAFLEDQRKRQEVVRKVVARTLSTRLVVDVAEPIVDSKGRKRTPRRGDQPASPPPKGAV